MKPTAANMNISDLFESRRATYKLCNDLAEAAKAGDLVYVTSLIEEYQGYSQKYDSSTFNTLVINAFWRSCENRHLECAKILQPFSEKDSHMSAHALHAACANADKEMVKLLIPLHDWNDDFSGKCILLSAVNGGSLDILKLILPCVPSKKNRTEALREASKIKNQNAFDLLYPLSNPQSALKYMDNRKTVTEDEKQMLKTAITAEQQNAILRDAVGDAGVTKRKMKI